MPLKHTFRIKRLSNPAPPRVCHPWVLCTQTSIYYWSPSNFIFIGWRR